MDQKTNFPQPNPYSVVHDAPKPASIKVFGILHVVFGAIGLICGGFGFLALVVMQSSNEMGDVIQTAMSTQYSEGYMTFIMFAAVIGLLLNIFLLTCGMGLLKERNWGRTWSLGYAVLGDYTRRRRRNRGSYLCASWTSCNGSRFWRNHRYSNRCDLPDLHLDFPNSTKRS